MTTSTSSHCLLAHADQGLSFFLDDRYRHRLAEPELLLRERLLTLAETTSPEERGTPAWGLLTATRRSLGLEQTPHDGRARVR